MAGGRRLGPVERDRSASLVAQESSLASGISTRLGNARGGHLVAAGVPLTKSLLRYSVEGLKIRAFGRPV
jgi:hypothetical protein